MLTQILSRRCDATPRLLLIFAGWGMDPRPFAGIGRDGYDTAVVWNYADPQPLPETLLEPYSEICVLAWSFGVPYAARFIAANQERLPITRCVAVNGTLCPVDDDRGIPRAIFDATQAALSESSLDKFRRRMAGSTKAYNEFMLRAPERSIESLAEELRRVEADGEAPDPAFDAIYVAGRDRIIPADNQIFAWDSSMHDVIIYDEDPHLPDFQAIIDAEFRNKELVARSFAAHGDTYAGSAMIQRMAAETLAWQFRRRLRSRQPVVEFGCGVCNSAELLFVSPSRMRLYDLAPVAEGVKRADAETEIAAMIAAEPRGIAGVISSSTIQWFNSPRRFIRRALRAMRPGKILALSTFTRATFSELLPYQSGRPSYLEQSQLAELAEALEREGVIKSGWDVFGQREFALQFRSTAELVRHLHDTGVNATQAPDVAAARRLMQSGLKQLTYDPVYFIVEKA